NEITTTYNVSPDQSVYLFVGRINFLKNVHFIVQSLKILKTKGRSFKMIFVGCGQDEIALNQLIVQLSLENDVIMAGKITDVKHLEKLYCRAKLFLFPSLSCLSAANVSFFDAY
ncbi:MAG: glycosyltransferase family 4 protein, partial [Bacteroidales bacterium]|nr:glycosyltransferase family 4 protein [Bacteroidales bacterium]